MPAPISNAVCGPQKPDTPTPPKGTDISELNPCPLNACCNIVSPTTSILSKGKGLPADPTRAAVGAVWHDRRLLCQHSWRRTSGHG
jgi:hypothetical protein